MSLSSSHTAKNRYDTESTRLAIDYLLDPEEIAKDDIQALINGLSQKQKSLPPRYFYDEKGSQLFEDICELPEYYPTRTEAQILKQYAQEIIQQTKVEQLVELGSGSSSKTRYLFDVYRELNEPLHYVPVDVSGSILELSANSLLTDYSQLKINGKIATYSQSLKQLSGNFLGKRIIIFLGSSIGNFNETECDRFIEQVTSALNPGDYFLLGFDLQKSPSILEAAYNDAQGVTAAFNLNMLQHLNNSFGGNFKLDLFKHQAIYNSQEHQIEMHLISQQNQVVTLSNLDLTIELAKGETILTEISRKFDLATMEKYLGERRLNLIKTYTDPQQWFGLLLCQYA